MTKVANRQAEAAAGPDEKWAALIASTRTTKRPFSLMRLSQFVEDAIRETGSLEAAAERIALSPRMLRQFRLVKRLDPLVQRIVSARKIDSVDAVGYLILLDSADQRFVARELAAGRIQTSDLRAIPQQRRLMPKIAIAAVVKQVTESRSRKVYVAEFAMRGSVTKKEVGRRVARIVGKDGISSIEIEGALGRVVFTRKGRDALRQFSRNQGVPLSKGLPRLIYQP